MSKDADIQIARAFEQGMDPTSIAEAFEYNESAVHMSLANNSRAYKIDVAHGRIDIPEEDVKEAVNTIVSIMKDETAKHSIRLSAAKWVVEEATGRNTAKSLMPQVNVNVVAIQDHLNRMKEARKRYDNVPELDVVRRDKVIEDKKES